MKLTDDMPIPMPTYAPQADVADKLPKFRHIFDITQNKKENYLSSNTTYKF